MLHQLQRSAGNQAVGALVAPDEAVAKVSRALAVRSTAARTADHRLARQLASILRADDDVDAADEAVPEGGGSTPAAGAGPAPTFDHSGGKTETINADTAMDFANNITAKLGAPHVTPEFTPDIQVDFKTDGAGKEVPGSRKISSIGLTVKTSITKVRYGMGRANDKHKAAIDQMVEMIKAHEEAHRNIIETEATAALKAAQKYVGTGKDKQAEKALTTDLECSTNKKHEALDGSEGKLTASEQADGSVTVTKSGVGATYPCP